MPPIGWLRKQGRLIKTGQLTPYGGYNDDGYYKKGLPKSYAVLTTGAQAGTTSITLNGKTDIHSNNCVYDRRTRLMWSRYVVASIGPGSDGKLPWTTNGNGEGIFAYCAAANAAKLGGYSDWRIPNLYELTSLNDEEQPTAAPDATAFPTWPTSTFLHTSTTSPSNTAQNIVIGFNSGYASANVKTTTYYVALVRGG